MLYTSERTAWQDGRFTEERSRWIALIRAIPPNATKPRGDIGHKGDGIRIPTTKGHESAKPRTERNSASLLGLAVPKAVSPPRIINPIDDDIIVKYINIGGTLFF